MAPTTSITALLSLLPILARATVPSVAGYTLTWSDDFIGSANSLPNTANWIIQTGTSYPGGPANWGTGEHETYTSSPNNVALVGDGTLRITPLKSSSGQWTSARIETQRTDFTAAAGKKMRTAARIQMPDVTVSALYAIRISPIDLIPHSGRRGSRLLARFLDPWRSFPGKLQ